MLRNRSSREFTTTAPPSEFPGSPGGVIIFIVGAMFAWAIGMRPNTVRSLVPDAGAKPHQEPQPCAAWLLAAVPAAVAAPLLALYQWHRLRKGLPLIAAYRLLEIAAAWASGISVIFLTARINEVASSLLFISGTAMVALLLACGIIGTTQQRASPWLLSILHVRRS